MRSPCATHSSKHRPSLDARTLPAGRGGLRAIEQIRRQSPLGIGQATGVLVALAHTAMEVAVSITGCGLGRLGALMTRDNPLQPGTQQGSAQCQRAHLQPSSPPKLDTQLGHRRASHLLRNAAQYTEMLILNRRRPSCLAHALAPWVQAEETTFVLFCRHPLRACESLSEEAQSHQVAVRNPRIVILSEAKDLSGGNVQVSGIRWTSRLPPPRSFASLRMTMEGMSASQWSTLLLVPEKFTDSEAILTPRGLPAVVV